MAKQGLSSEPVVWKTIPEPVNVTVQFKDTSHQL